MNSAGKKIFGNQEPVSANEMERYLGGQMNADEMNAFEQRMVDDDLAAEALEGFEGNEAMLGEIGLLTATFKSSIGAGGKGGILTSTTGKIIASSVVVAGATVAITVALMNTNPKTEESNVVVVVDEIEEPEEDVSEEAMKLAVPIEEGEQINFVKAVLSQPIAVPQNIPEEDVEDYVQHAILALDEIEQIDPLPIPIPEPKPEVPLRVQRSNRTVKIINHLLVIDYSPVYGDIEQNTIQNDADIHNLHLDSPFETFEQRETNEPQIITTYIPYLEYLEDALNLFEAGKFSDAVKHLETIRKQYPDDMNAHFYAGLCYYNLNKKSKAIEYFQTVQQNPANTFDQDAQFYEALTWIKKGNDVKATEVLTAIIELNDFYKGQAMELLAEIQE